MITAEFQDNSQLAHYNRMREQRGPDGVTYTLQDYRCGFEDAAYKQQEEIDRLRKTLQIIVEEMDQITIPARNISQRAKKALE